MEASLDSGRRLTTRTLVAMIAIVIIALLLILMFYRILGTVP